MCVWQGVVIISVVCSQEMKAKRNAAISLPSASLSKSDQSRCRCKGLDGEEVLLDYQDCSV